PNIETATEPTRPGGHEEHLQPITADSRACVELRAAQFGNQNGGTEPCETLERARIDIPITHAPRPVAIEIESGDPRLRVLEIGWARIVVLGIDTRTEVYRGLPAKITMCVRTIRSPVVGAPITSRAVTEEEQPVLVS